MAALEEERRKKVAVEEARLRTDAQMELLTIEIKKQPAKGAPAKGVSFKPEEEAGPPPNAVHGIHFNESNAIVRIEATSPNAPSAKAEPSSRLRVGDAVLDVCAEALDGHKVVKSLNEIEEAAPDAKLTLTVARPKYAREANALPTGDHVGWLYASLATDKCGKAIGEGRASRYWVALQADTLLIVSPREGGGAGKLGDITGALKTAEKSKVGANKGVMGTTKQLVGGGTAKNLVEKQGGGDGGPPVHPILGRDTEVGEREVKIRGATAKAFMTQSIKLGAGGEKVRPPPAVGHSAAPPFAQPPATSTLHSHPPAATLHSIPPQPPSTAILPKLPSHLHPPRPPSHLHLPQPPSTASLHSHPPAATLPQLPSTALSAVPSSLPQL